jgi:hypothetical protein
MNTEYPSGEEDADLINRINQARELYDSLKAALNRAMKQLDAQDLPKDRATALNALVRDYQKASLQVTEYEIALGKRRETILGSFGGGAIDLAEAKSEILGRIARIRERS